MLHTHTFICHQSCINVATDSFDKDDTRSERVSLFINDGNKVIVLGTLSLNSRDETSQLCFSKKTILSEMGIESVSETSCMFCMFQTTDSAQHNCDITFGTRIQFLHT